MNEAALETFERPLTKYELELINWLIEHGTYQDKNKLYSQIPLLSVRERCTCGCPTIYFALNGVAVPRRGELLISDHLASVDGEEVGVMLFETGGHLSSLEVYSCAGTKREFGLPAIASITPLPM